MIIYHDRVFTVKVDENKVSEEMLEISNLHSLKFTPLYLFHLLNESRKTRRVTQSVELKKWFNRVHNSVFRTVRSLLCRILLHNDYK